MAKKTVRADLESQRVMLGVHPMLGSLHRVRLFVSLLLVTVIPLASLSTLGLRPVLAASTVQVLTCDENHLLSAVTAAGPGGTVTFACSGVITLTSTLTLTQDVTIEAPGQAVAISGGNTVEVFSIASGVHVTFSRLTIENGYAANGGGISNNGGTVTITACTLTGNNTPENTPLPYHIGGGIYNLGTLTVTNSTFSNNSSDLGGGIANASGTVSIAHSTFTSNSADIAGAALNNLGGTTTITTSTFTSNSGTAINNAAGGMLTISSSTLSGNSATTAGAIANADGTLTISNSTLSGNTATDTGGAIFNQATMVITNSTLSGNSASRGGAIFVDAGCSECTTGNVTFTNTILAASPSGGNCAVDGGLIIDGGGNLDDGTTCIPATSTISLFNTTPQLGMLANNGGPTLTMALLPDSPAIGFGLEAVCFASGPGQPNGTDQRGDPRNPSRCDSGAYETNQPAAVTLSTLSQTYDGSPEYATAAVTPTACGPVTLSYSQNGTPISAPTTAGSYSVQAGLENPACTISGGGTGTLTIAQATQAITFAALPARLLGSAPFTVSGTGGPSGNPVTFTAGPSSTCTASGTNGTTITVVGVGTCTVTANQAASTNYQAAAPVPQSFSVTYPPLYLVQSLTSSPAGLVTTGSTVTAQFTLGNHTTASQTVTLDLSLRYTGSKGSFSLTVPLTVKLSAGQTVNQTQRFTVSKSFPRGSYTLSATASDRSGDTAGSSAVLTVS